MVDQPPDLVKVESSRRPGGYAEVHREAAEAYRKMVEAAREDGIKPPFFDITSGYRDQKKQQVAWENALKKYGDPEIADDWVARPGQSRHQTGKALDLWLGSKNDSENVTKQQETEAYKWLQENARSFGFIPYTKEPWHWRYDPEVKKHIEKYTFAPEVIDVKKPREKDTSPDADVTPTPDDGVPDAAPPAPDAAPPAPDAAPPAPDAAPLAPDAATSDASGLPLTDNTSVDLGIADEVEEDLAPDIVHEVDASGEPYGWQDADSSEDPYAWQDADTSREMSEDYSDSFSDSFSDSYSDSGPDDGSDGGSDGGYAPAGGGG
jgi:D-alanyl-D-alanine dipeptidase